MRRPPGTAGRFPVLRPGLARAGQSDRIQNCPGPPVRASSRGREMIAYARSRGQVKISQALLRSSAAAVDLRQPPDVRRQPGRGRAGGHPPAPVARRHAGDVDPPLAAQGQVVLHLGHEQLRHAAHAAPQQRLPDVLRGREAPRYRSAKARSASPWRGRTSPGRCRCRGCRCSRRSRRLPWLWGRYSLPGPEKANSSTFMPGRPAASRSWWTSGVRSPRSSAI